MPRCFLVGLLAVASLACGGALPFAPRPPEPTRTPANALVNPGFEGGGTGWTYPQERWYWKPFEVVD